MPYTWQIYTFWRFVLPFLTSFSIDLTIFNKTGLFALTYVKSKAGEEGQKCRNGDNRQIVWEYLPNCTSASGKRGTRRCQSPHAENAIAAGGKGNRRTRSGRTLRAATGSVMFNDNGLYGLNGWF